ncbi:MAG: hypothetical protein ACPL88_12030, partial [Bryobacteraceae bacterium]
SARRLGLEPAGRVRYDRAVTEAHKRGKPVVEHRRNGAAADIRELWATVGARLQTHDQDPLKG